MRNLFTHHTVEIPHKKFTLWMFSDMHFGTTAFDEDRFKWFLKRAAESENPYYLGVGDYCLPFDTEILTMNGFKYITDLEIGEKVCSYDKNTNTLQWTKLNSIYISKNQDTYRLKSKSFNFRCTNNHGWFVTDQTHSNAIKKPLSDLKTQHRIRVSAPMIDNSDIKYLDVTPDDCYLLGWIVTDGHIKQKGNNLNVSIIQSAKKYLLHLKEKLNGKYTNCYKSKYCDCETINIKTSIARELFEKFNYNSKNDLPKIVTMLNSECRQAMLKAFIEAEGWIDGNTTCFAQLSGGVLEAYRILCTLSGIRIGVSCKNKNGVITHKQSNKTNVTFNDLHKTKEINSAVWCPMTDMGSIVARQGNTITITGNCDFAAMGDMKKIKHSDLHETTEERIDHMVQSDNAKIADLCKQMKGRLIGMIGGNHQYTFTTGKLSDEDLCERLQAKYLGWLSIIKLSLKIRNGFAVSCYIFACHGQGGGKLLGTSINKIDDMTRIINNADIYVQGHDHKRSATPKTVLSVYDNSGNFFLKQKRQYLVRSGSFQKSYEKDSSGFAQGRLMQPADLGAVRLNIGTHRDRKGGFDRIILDIEAVI